MPSEGQKKLGKMTFRSHVGQMLSLPRTTEVVSAELILKGKIRISLILAGFLLNNLVFFGLYIGFYV